MSKASAAKLIVPIFYAVAGMAYCAWVLTQMDPTAFQYLGALVSAVSFVLWVVARVQLAENFSLAAKANKLVTVGLYSKLSHPVYYFSITALGGLVLVSQNWIIALAWGALVILEIIRIRAEEQVLLKKFGEDYIRYKAKVWL